MAKETLCTTHHSLLRQFPSALLQSLRSENVSAETEASYGQQSFIFVYFEGKVAARSSDVEVGAVVSRQTRGLVTQYSAYDFLHDSTINGQGILKCLHPVDGYLFTSFDGDSLVVTNDGSKRNVVSFMNDNVFDGIEQRFRKTQSDVGAPRSVAQNLNAYQSLY